MPENARNLAENSRRPFLFSSLGDRLKKLFEKLFFFWRTLAPVSLVLGLGLSLVSTGSVLGRAVLGPEFFLCLGLGVKPCVLDPTFVN